MTGKKKRLPLVVVVCLICVVAMFLTLIRTLDLISEAMTLSCFSSLEASSAHLADELLTSILQDRAILKSEAAVLAASGDLDAKSAGALLDEFDIPSSYLSYVELLLPDNTLVLETGESMDASGLLDFQAEAEKGLYISDKSGGLFDPEDQVLRNAVPVVRRGRTVGMLYGVVSLSELPDKYRVDAYKGNSFVLVEDGNTGEFLIDTWHRELGSIDDLGERTTLADFDMDEAIADMARGESGAVGFISQSTGKIMYMYYTPVGVNNWSIMLMVAEETAFAEAREINRYLYIFAGIELCLMLISMLAIVIFLANTNHSIARISREDQTTALLNRNAFELRIKDYDRSSLPPPVCIYVDVNGLHEINNNQSHAAGDALLQTVADSLKEHFPYEDVFRVGGDEFVVIHENSSREECASKMEDISRSITAQGYSISYGITVVQPGQCLGDTIREADGIMLDNKRQYYCAHDRRRR